MHVCWIGVSHKISCVGFNSPRFFSWINKFFVDGKCAYNRIPSSSCMLHFVLLLLDSSILNGSKLVLVVNIMYGTYRSCIVSYVSYMFTRSSFQISCGLF
jgi:hypothetical protein